MKIRKIIKKDCCVVKIIVEENGIVMGRAYLYLINNDLHKKSYGLLEDVFIDEKYRGQGAGSKLLEVVINEAKKRKCYKLIGTSRKSRKKVHDWYKKLGFKDYGLEFRMDL